MVDDLNKADLNLQQAYIEIAELQEKLKEAEEQVKASQQQLSLNLQKETECLRKNEIGVGHLYSSPPANKDFQGNSENEGSAGEDLEPI